MRFAILVGSLFLMGCVRVGFEPHASSGDRPLAADRQAAASDGPAAERQDRSLTDAASTDRPRDLAKSDGPGPARDSSGGPLWTSLTSSVTTNHLYGVFGLSDADFFAVGYNGTILRCIQQTCVVEGSTTQQHLYQIWGRPSASSFWAVGNGGTVLQRLAPGGWSKPAGLPTLSPLQQLFAVHGGTDLWAGGAGGVLLRMTTAWEQITFSSDHISSIWARASEAFVLAGIARRVHHFTGSAWVLEAVPGQSGELSGIAGCGTDLFVVGTQGQVYQRVAGQWIARPAPATAQLQAVACRSATEIYVVGSSGSSPGPGPGLVLRGNGTSWTDITPVNVPTLNAVWLGQSAIVAVGLNGTIMRGQLP